jgi:hypothetical protein
MEYHFIIEYIPDWGYFTMLGILMCCACWCFYDEHLRRTVNQMIAWLSCRGREEGGRRVVIGLRTGDPITTARVYPVNAIAYRDC